jgi:hypothetical protein
MAQPTALLKMMFSLHRQYSFTRSRPRHAAQHTARVKFDPWLNKAASHAGFPVAGCTHCLVVGPVKPPPAGQNGLRWLVALRPGTRPLNKKPRGMSAPWPANLQDDFKFLP